LSGIDATLSQSQSSACFNFFDRDDDESAPASLAASVLILLALEALPEAPVDEDDAPAVLAPNEKDGAEPFPDQRPVGCLFAAVAPPPKLKRGAGAAPVAVDPPRPPFVVGEATNLTDAKGFAVG